MKILYLSIVPTEEKGVHKKIEAQIKAFKSQTHKVFYLHLKKIRGNNETFYLNDIPLMSYRNNNKNFIAKIKGKIDEIKLFKVILKKISKKEIEIDTIYIRYISSSPWIISFLKKLKRNNIKIILEVPTYPYDGEKSRYNIFSHVDKHYRKKLKYYVNYIVTYTKDKKIFEVPCINISNGVDLEKIKMISRKKEKLKNLIVFTSVSNQSFWHGIDRFLFSLKKYKLFKESLDVKVNIIGKGNETERLKKIVEEDSFLSKKVNFLGFMTGNELDEIYNQTDLAIGSLGLHRIKGLKEVQPLKNREYAAKGLPFIIGFEDPDFKKEKFTYQVSSDENLFDIDKIIKWYKTTDLNSEEIRRFSEKFSWNEQIKKIVREIEGY